MYRADLEEIFEKLEPDEALKHRILERMDEQNMKKLPRMGVRSLIAAVACVTIIGVGSVFAAGNIISYFQSGAAVELTDLESLAKYNEAVGASASKFGYTVTLDNLAVDDNFLHIFYTLKSEKPIKDSGEGTLPFFECRVNGQLMGYGNHNERDGYFADDYTYKGVEKWNVAAVNIPEQFKLELYSRDFLGEPMEEEYQYFSDELLNLTEEDISKLLYVSTSAKKSVIETNSLVKDINKKFTLEYYDENNNLQTGRAEISKVIFSPFGNQLVVTDDCGGCGGAAVSGWALLDADGRSLDILNTDLTGVPCGEKSVNVLEFLKADATTKYLKLVPMNISSSEPSTPIEKQEIGTYPMTFKTSNYGSIVVTGIRIADGEINIDYYKDGFSLYDAEFELLDKDGNDMQPGGKLGCALRTRVHHRTNSYTAQYKYYDENEPGAVPESMSKEKLESALHSICLMGDCEVFVPDYDNAIELELK